MYNDMMGMGEKTPKNIRTRKKTRKNSPFGFPPFISCKNAGRHKALSFVGKGKGAVLQ